MTDYEEIQLNWTVGERFIYNGQLFEIIATSK